MWPGKDDKKKWIDHKIGSRKELSHPGWYREFRRGGEDHDTGCIRFNERQQ